MKYKKRTLKIAKPQEYNLWQMTWFQCAVVAICLSKLNNKERIRHYIRRFLAINSLGKSEYDVWLILNKRNEANGTISKLDLYFAFSMSTVITKEQIEKLVKQDVDKTIDEETLRYRKLHEQLNKILVLKEMENSIMNFKSVDYSKCEQILNKSIAMYKNDEILENLEKIYNEKSDNTTISTCIDELDKLRARFRKGTVNAIMGYTGSYKTMYCVNVAYKAIQDGLNVCYVSLEISKKEMYYNFLSRYSNEATFEQKISHTDMKFKELNEEEKKYLFGDIVPSFIKNYSQYLTIVDENDFSANLSYDFDNIFNTVDINFVNTTGHGVDLVVIDHLNLLKFDNKNEQNDYAKINHWMAYFRKNCRNFARKHKEVCFIVAVQSNRSSYDIASCNGGQFTLTGAAEGNEIERASELFIALYSDSGLKENKKAKIQLLKGRNVGEMQMPLLISVEPKYCYITSCKANDYEEENVVDFSIPGYVSES